MNSWLWLDYETLRFINVTAADPGMDQFWLVLTHLERVAWFAWGVFPILLVWLFYLYKWRAFSLLFVVGLTVAMSDLISYRILKAWLDRPRPFENDEISAWLRQVGDAHGPSFPSNHAANCFAAACVLSWYFPRRGYFFFIFAALVAYSRVALGVHYPSDVIGGALLGISVGFLVRILLLKRVSRLSLVVSVSKPDMDSGHWRTRIRRFEDD